MVPLECVGQVRWNFPNNAAISLKKLCYPF